MTLNASTVIMHDNVYGQYMCKNVCGLVDVDDCLSVFLW